MDYHKKRRSLRLEALEDMRRTVARQPSRPYWRRLLVRISSEIDRISSTRYIERPTSYTFNPATRDLGYAVPVDRNAVRLTQAEFNYLCSLVAEDVAFEAKE